MNSTKKAKKACKILTIIWSVCILLSLFPLIFWLIFYAPDIGSVQYYSDAANYTTFDCTIQSFSIGEDDIQITFEHTQSHFYDDFSIDGKNCDLAIENGIEDILQTDALFTITSASAYLGDGWSYPVVALSYNGREIIPFDEGQENYVEIRLTAENQAKAYIIVWGSIVGAFVIFDICSITGLIKQKDKR